MLQWGASNGTEGGTCVISYCLWCWVPGGVVAAQPPTVREEPAPAARDAVERWNEAALEAIRSEKTPPPVAARNLALVHVAMYDAVVAVEGGYSPFYFSAKAREGADAEAAASAAAHRTLVELYPKRVRDLDRVLDDALTRVPDGPAKSRGVKLGLTVAEQVLKWRAKDTTVSRSGYTPRTEAGRWRPTPPDERAPLLPEWGAVSCFAVPDGSKFRPPGPPALDSDAYAESYRFVKALGGTASRERTREQTEIALFWAGGEGTVTPPGQWNRIARSAAAGRKLSLVESARLYALLNVAMCDAAMVCWDSKYRYDSVAAGDRDPRGRSDLDAAADDAAVPGLHVGAQLLQRRRGGGAGGVSSRATTWSSLPPPTICRA